MKEVISLVADIIFILSGVLVFGVLVFGIVVYLRVSKKNSAGQSSLQAQQMSQKNNKADSSSSGTSQAQEQLEACNSKSYLPYKTISGFVGNLGDYQYRAVLEVSSMNRSLKTAEENQMIDALFQQYLNAVKFRTRMFLQTREIDNKNILSDLARDIEQNVPKFPALKEYAELYYNGMENLSSQVGNSKQKKKFVIIPYDDVWQLDELNDIEKEEYAIEQLRNYVNIVKSELEGVGLTVRLLYDEELYKLLYACFHRDGAGIAEDIAHGYFSTLVVSGKNILLEQSADEVANMELNHTMNRLQRAVERSTDLTATELERYNRILSILDMLKTRFPDKQDDLEDIFSLAGEDAILEAMDNGDLDSLFDGSDYDVELDEEPYDIGEKQSSDKSHDWDDADLNEMDKALAESILKEEKYQQEIKDGGDF